MVVHRQESLTTPQLLSTWALFAFSAGAVNAGALLACQRFVAHVTGTVTRIGVDAHDVLALDYLLVLVAFVGGAAAAIALARRFATAGRPAYTVPLLLVAAILAVIASLGHTGLFGRFGSTVETAHDFLLLALLSLAMGMQNAAVAASTAMAVRTTHMTGPATDIGVALALMGSDDVEERASARRSLLLRVTLLVAFVVGGTLMAGLCPRFAFASFVMPAVAIVVATARGYAVSEPDVETTG